MPKLKTNKSVKKRFRKTALGKYKRTRAGKGHLLTHKQRNRKRALNKAALTDKTDIRKIRRMLPYG
jgi:large subunit ribosomal protein L35